jgi:hypothetical protein
MFVRVNKGDGTPDDTGGKGGWWTVQPGVPDEGRPGRKAKAKRAKDGLAETGSVATSSVAGTPVPMGEHELPLSQQSQSQSQPQSQLQQTHAPRDVFESAPPLPVKHEMSAAPTPLLPAFEPSRAAEPGWADRPEPPREQASPPVPASAPAPPSASAPAPPPLKTEPQNVPT